MKEVLASPGTLVPAAPILEVPSIPRVILCDLVPAGQDGTGATIYRLEPRTMTSRVELTPELALALGWRTGYPAENTKQLRRLIRAGFVVGERITPSRYMIDLDDYLNRFLKDVEDPAYWDCPHRRRQYRETYERCD